MILPATYDTVNQAVDQVFAAFPLRLEGKRVLIKPNALRSSSAEEGIVTHPAVLRAVVEKVEQEGPAELVVGDNPGIFSYGANEACFEKTGLREAALGHYRNIGNDSVRVAFNPEYMASVSISRAVSEADILISLPKFKTHGLTVMTGAIKNSYGFLPGAQKAKLHKAAGSPEAFHKLVVDVFKLRVPDLFIVDAVVGMEGNGPASPDLRDIGRILASDNAVALDAVIARMMGCLPEKLGFLLRAKELGIGPYEEEQIDIIGDFAPIPGFNLPPLGGEAIASNSAVQEVLESRARLTPRPDPQACTACGYCVDQCAVGALTMVDDLPRVDADTCITCFCCQEMCPEKAMHLEEV
jgi:uncharacterized protein (DUF362 family)/NAD-dependent dihydropyrimidine dehydrogenase PreA subunit